MYIIWNLVQIFSPKQKTDQILPAIIEKKSNFVCSRKEPVNPSDYNF